MSYLVEVSAKYSERADFQQLIQPVLVGEEELQKLLAEFRVLEGKSMSHNGVHSFYSEERRYPFNRVLILESESNFGQKESIDKLLVNLCSFVHYPATPPSVAHELTAKS
jgi:hypothetical protein